MLKNVANSVTKTNTDSTNGNYCIVLMLTIK